MDHDNLCGGGRDPSVEAKVTRRPPFPKPLTNLTKYTRVSKNYLLSFNDFWFIINRRQRLTFVQS